MEHLSEKRYPVSSKDYKLYEEVGEGVSATVYRALCIPLNEMVAIKVLDLEKCNNDLVEQFLESQFGFKPGCLGSNGGETAKPCCWDTDIRPGGIRREVQTMSLIDHPNVLRAHCSFITDQSLWVVMPYMAGGSCLHIMKSAYPEGFEEPVIATLLREVLKALVYLHRQGHIHRDVKAGNILIDADGAVKLADFGVSACMFDTGDRQRSRNTFAGTPCWMAPEVMQQLHGYDFKADIWSFGITAMELAHGHAPFSKYPPMKVLLMTLQNAPPGLDYERDKRFSKSFKEMVAACLVKDPKKRPTSEKLLKHHFFKHARSNEYLARTILNGLRPLGERFRMLKEKESDFLQQNKVMYGGKEQLSQREYIRGISGWNFDLEDLKSQAALIPNYDGISNVEDRDINSKMKDGSDHVNSAPDVLSPKRVNHANAVNLQEGGLHDLQDVDGSLTSFPILPLQALKGYFDVSEDDVNGSSPKDAIQIDPEKLFELQQSSLVERVGTKKYNGDFKRSSPMHKKIVIPEPGQKSLSGSLLPEHILSSSRKVAADGERENFQQKHPSERNYSGPLMHRHRRDINNLTSASTHALAEASEGTVVQQKGRFKITSADVGPKVVHPPNHPVSPVGRSLIEPTIIPSLVLPSLQFMLQQNAMQREQIIKLIKCVEQTSGHQMEIPDAITTDLSQLPPAPSREIELQSQVLDLQQSIESIAKELQSLKLMNAQLERRLNTLVNKDEGERT